jgi:hypothetical protein
MLPSATDGLIGGDPHSSLLTEGRAEIDRVSTHSRDIFEVIGDCSDRYIHRGKI